MVLLTASMGAGHDGVTQELAQRLNRRGIPTVEIHFWQLLPFGIGALIMGFYRWMILRAPWLYEFIYRAMLRPSWWTAHSSPVSALAERRLAPWVRSTRPSAMVSTFHLCSQVLGDMRRKGTLEAPAVSLVVDFAAHGSWVNPDVDLHLCLHPSQAARVIARGAKRVEVCGPVVLTPFEQPRLTKGEARATLGLDSRDRVVLVVAGSWGAGDVVRTAQVLADERRFTVLVAAGDNDHLVRRLHRLGDRVRAIGWVDDMDRLIAASDVVVENAGGLTAMEAMAMGRPVVSHLPIPGHGLDNVRYMAEAGITEYTRSAGELVEAIDVLAADSPERARAVARGKAIFASGRKGGSAADRIEDLVLRPGPAGPEVAAPAGSGAIRYPGEAAS